MGNLSASVVHGFAGSMLSRRYDNAVPTPQFHLELWDLCCSNSPLVAVAAPRGHGKSTAVSHAYVLASVLFRDRKFVLLVSDTETQSVNFLNDIKQDLKDNEDIVDLFQIKGFKKETESDIIVEFQDGACFRIMCRGAEQRVRGLKWNQARPDLIVCDDVESDEQVSSKERREKLQRWFNGALLPCRAKHGIVRIVGTVMHLDSLLNRLLPEDSAKLSVVDPLKTWSREKKPIWKAIRYRAHNEDFSQLLWEEQYDKEFFIHKRKDLTDQGIPEVYAQEYLNYPIDESTSYFRRDDFQEISRFELDKIKSGEKLLNFYVGTDLAVSTKDRSDYSVFIIVGADDRGVLYVLDVRRSRQDSLEIIDEFFSIQRRYSPHWFAMEKGSITSSLGPILKSEMNSRGTYFNLETSVANKDKATRARGIQARLRAGSVKFNKEASWYPELEDEFCRFPKARHDDQVDALAWVGLTIDSVQHANTPEEENEAEYQSLIREYADDGRDTICGY
jgi:predicted phage terminase large subunit-like protein